MPKQKKIRKKSSKNLKLFKCKHCKTTYKTEIRFQRHNCKYKQRIELRNTDTVQIAFTMWKKIFGRGTIERFDHSNEYLAFVEFVAFCQIENLKFIDDFFIWLRKNGISINKWRDVKLYNMFIKQFLLTEHPRDAITRSLEFIQTTEYPIDYFKTCPPSLILTHIETGSISPWLVLLYDYGGDFFHRLNEEKTEYFMKLVNLELWNYKIKRLQKTVNTLKTELQGVKI